MNDLPYFCHVCSAVVYIEDRVECPLCRESFLEVYTAEQETVPYLNGTQGEPTEQHGLFKSLFGGLFRTSRQPRRHQTITSDRRNYAIGPEIHDIITQMREEKQIEENPATQDQLSTIKQVNLPESEVCMVCLNTFQENEAGELYPCNHYFHTPCSNAWLELQSECPICRKSL
ncbi:E3 ubiquitin-protein ligase RNF115/126 [Nematocida displodere]|uniref:E3 ubiquitin-protein ligase RNF115/126 n=1 Tax=Nematocida displodere TaxID=1805483 RepID=A0A177EKW4_9MICR|nr:E3 ubiquitin-protein ligase RNF115/126 [Nematocida displodere]